MKRKVITTNDGSKTIYIEAMDETYHSSHGAIQEAKHVFLEHGLKDLTQKEVKVFEMGFGTGLNALLTSQYAAQTDVKVDYHGIEAFPVTYEMAMAMDYTDEMEAESKKTFEAMHLADWDQDIQISSNFSLRKIHDKIELHDIKSAFYDIIYYDAFGPRAQSEMWELSVLTKMYDCLKDGGVLVTYCAQGQFKRHLKSLGFTVEALPGPPGKREMTRAWKK